MKTLLIGIGGALTVMTAAGAWLVMGGEEGAPLALNGSELKIAVVAPVEPTPEPGGIMQVGALRDDYEHDPALLQPPAPYDPWLQVAWVEPDPVSYHEPVVQASAPDVPAAPAAPIRLDASDRSFGFDQAAPDYAAERAARMARMEATQAADAAASAVADALPAPARLARDSVFF